MRTRTRMKMGTRTSKRTETRMLRSGSTVNCPSYAQ
jgi:hypothetical protein